MNLTNFVGRRIDIAAFQGFSDSQQVLLRPALADAGLSGEVLTGILKLAQRFLLELFTIKGSITFDPTRGSNFMLEARQGLIRTPTDVTAAFNRALIDINRSLTGEDTDSDPLDEQFDSALLSSLQFAPGFAQIFITLASKDPAAKIILPVPLAF